MMRYQPLTQLLAILVLVLSAALPSHVNADESLKLVLVRHAEKVDKSAGSALTALGESRAAGIAHLLKDEAITHIYSTPYNRALLTAKPTADQRELAITEYDAGDLETFADELRNLRGVVLVVGHSNTTPILANHLLGTDFTSLDESIYDRVYVVSIGSYGDATLNMLHTEPRTP